MKRVMTVSDVNRRAGQWRRRDFLVCWSGLVLHGQVPGGGLSVEHSARALTAGEVVLLRVVVPASFEAAAVEASWGERSTRFTQLGLEHTWVGLLGVDLDAPVAPVSVHIAARDARRSLLERDLELALQRKTFRTRRLDVPPRYVTPPKSVQARIEREQRVIREILSRSAPSALWQGAWLRPVPGISLSSFGVRSVFNGQARSPHTGTDFRAPLGTILRAPAAGTVVLAEEHYFSGNQVVMDHGSGTFSFFAHLSRFDVQQGDRVERGAVLGATGATGRVTGPHLHWAARVAGARVDAESLLEVTAGLDASPA